MAQRPQPRYRTRSRSESGSHADPALAVVAAALVAKVLLTWQLLHVAVCRGSLLDSAVVLAVAALLWAAFRGRRRGRLAFYAADATFTLVLLATALYGVYYGDVISPRVVVLAGLAGEVGGSIRDLLSPVHALYVIDFAVLAALESLWRRRGSAEPRVGGRVPRGVTALALAPAAAVAVVFAMSAYAVASHRGPLNSTLVAAERGVFAYQVGSALHQEGALAEEVLRDADTPEERAAAVAAAIEAAVGRRARGRLDGVAQGAAAGANVIVVQVEALQTFAVGARVDGRDVTPNLTRLAEECWYFPNGTAQVGAGTTVDAEFAANTSCYPPPAQAASVAYDDRVLTSLPRLLREADYEAVTFHTNRARFWNRRQFYPALGFDRYYDDQFFGKKDKIGFSASDEVLFDKGLEEIQRIRAEGRRVYANFVTVTSHHPYDPLPDRKDPYEPPEPYAGTRVGGYLSHMEYADRALGGLIDDLKASGLWDESIVIVYGDHHAFKAAYFGDEDAQALEALLGRESANLDRMTVPLFVHVPGRDDGHVREDVVGQIDVMPTVLDLLGIDAAGTPIFGRSVFEVSPVVIGVRGYGVGGAMIDESGLVVPQAEADAATLHRFSDPTAPTPASAAQVSKLDDVALLLDLSDAYVRGLPARDDYVEDEDAIIPGVTDR